MVIFVFDWVKNIVGKEENAGKNIVRKGKMQVTSIFSFSQNVFKGLFF